MKLRVLTLILLAAAPVVACDTAQDETAETEPAADQPAMQQQAMTPDIPDTTGDAVWAHIQDAGYTDWQMWPDRQELYDGGQPHGALLTTYLNDIAREALTGGSGELPTGSVIVKENYSPDSTLMAVTTMVKTDGENPDHNDWYFTKHGADGALQAAGKSPPCAACHNPAQRDYLLTADESPYSGGGQ